MRIAGVALMSLLAAGASCACAAAAPEAAPPNISDSAANPLDRAVFLALPGVYEVRAEIPVRELRLGSRSFPVRRRLTFRGTAFGVGPGEVVTARHVVAPGRKRLVADVVAAFHPAGLPADTTRLRVFPEPEARITLTRARTEAVALAVPDLAPRAFTAKLIDDDAQGDMALLDLDDPSAPTLPLSDDVGRRTPVAVIGFGGTEPGPVPSVRTATLDGLRETEKTNDERFGGLQGVTISPGDSGGPVIDADGFVHGVVLRPQDGEIDPVIGRIQTILDILPDTGSGPVTSPNATTAAFRDAMAAFWRRDYGSASAQLASLRSLYGDAALVTMEERRAVSLASARYAIHGPSRARGAILALGAISLVIALAFGAIRVRRARGAY